MPASTAKGVIHSGRYLFTIFMLCFRFATAGVVACTVVGVVASAVVGEVAGAIVGAVGAIVGAVTCAIDSAVVGAVASTSTHYLLLNYFSLLI